MKKMQTTAKKLDTFFRIAQIGISIALVACVVALGIIGTYFLFDLSPEMIGTGYGNIEIGFLELTAAESYPLSKDVIILGVGAQILLGIFCLLTGRGCVQCVRSILAPMIEGTPFHSAVSKNLSKLARHTISLGIELNLMQIIGNVLTVQAYDLTGLLLSGNIVHVTVNYTFDLGFLVIAAVFLLLSFVFRYGEELQQLSDETL